MKQSFYENGIQGLAYNTSDAMVACDLDDPGVRTLAARVDMPEGMVEFHMNVDRLGYVEPEMGQEEFDLAVKAAKLFVAAPELLAAALAMQCADVTTDEIERARDLLDAAIAKAGGGE